MPSYPKNLKNKSSPQFLNQKWINSFLFFLLILVFISDSIFFFLADFKDLEARHFYFYLFRIFGYSLSAWIIKKGSLRIDNTEATETRENVKLLGVESLTHELTKSQEVSRQSVKALEKTREDLSARIRELYVLHETMTQISSSLDLNQVTNLIVTRCCEEVGAERAFLLRIDKGKLKAEKHTGLSDITIKHFEGEVDVSPFSSVVKNKMPLKLDKEENKDKFMEFLGTKEKIKSILAVPLVCSTKADPIGVLGVINVLQGDKFTDSQVEFLSTLGGQAAVAIENASLFQALKNAHRDTIMCLSTAAEFKDTDTASHLKRMSSYSAVIAEKLGLARELVELIYLASPMHDIGKIGISDAILLKPGKLTVEEFEEMKKHPIIGGAILDNVDTPLLQLSQQIALCHHEKFDGTGYPRGTSGKEIPLAARIIAVGDVFDALTTKRSYKPAFSLEDALSYMESQKGLHFDPVIIDAFFSSFDKIKLIYNKEQEPDVVLNKKLLPKQVEQEGWTLRY